MTRGIKGGMNMASFGLTKRYSIAVRIKTQGTAMALKEKYLSSSGLSPSVRFLPGFVMYFHKTKFIRPRKIILAA
jgi:hypothetical protein